MSKTTKKFKKIGLWASRLQFWQYCRKLSSNGPRFFLWSRRRIVWKGFSKSGLLRVCSSGHVHCFLIKVSVLSDKKSFWSTFGNKHKIIYFFQTENFLKAFLWASRNYSCLACWNFFTERPEFFARSPKNKKKLKKRKDSKRYSEQAECSLLFWQDCGVSMAKNLKLGFSPTKLEKLQVIQKTKSFSLKFSFGQVGKSCTNKRK